MDNGTYASADDILGFNDLKMDDVKIPEWGGKVVRVREMTAKERAEHDALLMDVSQRMRVGGTRKPEDGQEIEIKLHAARVRIFAVAACCIDGSGKQLFSKGDAVKLEGKSASAIAKLYDRIAKLSGLGAENETEALTSAGESSASSPDAASVSE